MVHKIVLSPLFVRNRNLLGAGEFVLHDGPVAQYHAPGGSIALGSWESNGVGLGEPPMVLATLSNAREAREPSLGHHTILHLESYKSMSVLLS